jgi:hypothetical protein
MKMLVTAAVLLAGLSAAPASAGPLAGPAAASPVTITDMSSARVSKDQFRKIAPAKHIAKRVRLLKPAR